MSPRLSRHSIFDPLRLPVVAAPMFLVTGPELVLAACKSGIMASPSTSTARSPGEYAEWLDRFESELGEWERGTGKRAAPYACNLSISANRRLNTEVFDANVRNFKARRVPIVITLNGAPDEIVQEVHGWGGLIFHDVTTVRHAERAVAAGVDGLILICGGGGGHSGTLNPFAFVPQVREFFDGIIVLAGALGSGSAVRAAEMLGADLCYMGTRFIATQESLAPAAYKQMLVEAASTDLIYTPTFTHGVPASMLKAAIRAHGMDPDNLPPPPGRDDPPLAVKAWRDIWAAGQSVGLIRDLPAVVELVDRLEAEYAAATPGGVPVPAPRQAARAAVR